MKKKYSKLLYSSKVAYFNEIIDKKNQRQLLQIMKSLKHYKDQIISPDHPSKSQLTNEFNGYLKTRSRRLESSFHQPRNLTSVIKL